MGGAGEGFLREPGLGPETRGFETVNVVVPVTLICATSCDDSVIRLADETGVLAFCTVITLPTSHGISNKWFYIQAFVVEGISTDPTAFNQVSRSKG